MQEDLSKYNIVVLGNGNSVKWFIKKYFNIYYNSNIRIVSTNSSIILVKSHYLAIRNKHYRKHRSEVNKAIKISKPYIIMEPEQVKFFKPLLFPDIVIKKPENPPFRTVGMYAVWACMQMGAKNFILAGFDGNDSKNLKRRYHFHGRGGDRDRTIRDDINAEYWLSFIYESLINIGGSLKIVTPTIHSLYYNNKFKL